MNIKEATVLRIKEICNKKHITLNKLATTCGMTRSTLSNIVSGRNQSTTLATLKRICDGMDITIQDFFNSDFFVDLDQEIE